MRSFAFFVAGVAVGLAARKAAALCAEFAEALGELTDPYGEEPPVVHTTRRWVEFA